MQILRLSGWLVIVCLTIVGCTRAPVTQKTAIAPKTLPDLRGYLLSHKADVDLFRLRGPFAVSEHAGRELRLSARERIPGDLYLASASEKAALVILMHGHDSSKEAHAFQCMHLASWGVHCLAVQLSKTGPWSANGRTLARIVDLVHRSPDILDPRIDSSRIILAGHSFGAISVAVALTGASPAAGGIMLDPASIGRDVPKFLQQVGKPVIILGADEEIAPTRNRHYFYRFIRGAVAEISIRDAVHEDAQYPSETSLTGFGIDTTSTEEGQVSFVSALTAAALSLSFTGSFDYAWTSFGEALEKGRFFNARRK